MVNEEDPTGTDDDVPVKEVVTVTVYRHISYIQPPPTFHEHITVHFTVPNISDPNKAGRCSINRNLQGWGNWFLNKGAVVSKAGSVVTILGLSVDAIPTPPTWITGSTGVAIGGGMVVGGTVMQTAGAAFLYASGDQRGAAQGAIGILLAAPQNDISAIAPTDPTDATAAAITNAIYGPNTCQ
jgi:hypothetical protein